MDFVIIFGPPAVGKMTVGRELARLTGLKLFHNHMTIELALNFFEYGHPAFYRLVADFRRRVFEEVAASDLRGLVFTYVWALEREAERAYVESITGIFRARGAGVYFVELYADLAERVRRNEDASRLAEKPSKRDVEASLAVMLEHVQKHKLNTDGDFFYEDNYLRLDNTRLPPEEAARRIVKAFNLETAGGEDDRQKPEGA